MHVVLGLGNPGRRYERTRHNLGFRCVDALAARAGAAWEASKRFWGEIARIDAPAPALLVKPSTYMNESGRAAHAVLNFHDVPLDDLLVVCDDLDLVPGRIRLRASGGSGGHNGLKSIAAHLGSQQFPRLRIGIGRPAVGAAIDTADFVLTAFEAGEEAPVVAALDRAADAAASWMTEGIARAMERCNAEPGSPATPATAP